MAKNTDNTAPIDEPGTPELDAVTPTNDSDVATAPVNSTGYDQATGAFNN